MADLHEDLVNRFSSPDLEDIDRVFDIYGSSPTLERWVSNEVDREDMALVLATMSAAFDAGARSRERHERGDPYAMDLPIGAALIDTRTGYVYSEFAQDCERGVDTDHAEVLLIRKAQLCGVDLTSVVLGVTVECCPTCIEAIEEAGIPRVFYGASRRDLEAAGLIKKHDVHGPDIVISGRQNEDKYHFEFMQLPDREFQEACLELVMGFDRVYETRRSHLRVGKNATDAVRAQAFRRAMVNGARKPELVEDDGSIIEQDPIEPETVYLNAFRKIFEHRS